MAYNRGGEARVNFYSSPNIQYQGFPTGTKENDNARALTRVRFAVENIGDESMTCPAFDTRANERGCSDRFRYGVILTKHHT